MAVDINALKAQIDELAALAASAPQAAELEQAHATISTLQARVAELEGMYAASQAIVDELQKQHAADEALLAEAAAKIDATMAFQSDPDTQAVADAIGKLVAKYRDRIPQAANGALALWLSPSAASQPTP